MDHGATTENYGPVSIIDRVRNEDLPQLIDLYRQMQPSTFSLEEMAETLRETAGDHRHVFLAARRDGLVVGTALGVICRMLYGGRRSFMVVEDVVVDESSRRHGIGRRLMHELEEQARRSNCSYIMLVTDAFRTGSQRFYRSLGYACDGYVAFKKQLP